MIEQLPEIDRLKPYFKIAEQEAKKSECTRRKFGALIVKQGFDVDYAVAANYRQSKCCNGSCARTRLQLHNGERTEVGAEVHAEIACLIRHGPKVRGDSEGWLNNYFLIAGYDSENKPLYGKILYPCHACALAIKFAGFQYVYIREAKDRIMPISINEILEYRELEQEAENDNF